MPKTTASGSYNRWDNEEGNPVEQTVVVNEAAPEVTAEATTGADDNQADQDSVDQGAGGLAADQGPATDQTDTATAGEPTDQPPAE